MKKFLIALLFGLLIFDNGCLLHTNKPRNLILISIDGFRWDYPEKADTPNLDFLIRSGVRAKRLTPSFPTKTFPNHYTIVTGLYPENHGIIANNMYDADIGGYFKLSLPDAIHDPRWWGGEPIWVTAEKQGQISACFFWPGSSTKIKDVLPTHFYKYDGSIANEDRVQQVLEWLSLPDEERPAMITTYFSTLDDAGHRHGPDSEKTAEAITTIDSVIGLLVEGLRERDMLDKVNILIVSDHGMAPISDDRKIFLDDYIDLATVDVVDWNPVAAIRPLSAGVEEVYEKLANAHPHMQVYRKSEVPERWHFRSHPRIPEVIAVADEGWSFISHETYARKPDYVRGGNHGFDNELESMGAVFIAHGPAFKSGVTTEPVLNIHLYELMCEVLGLEPVPNDGSLDSVSVMLR